MTSRHTATVLVGLLTVIAGVVLGGCGNAVSGLAFANPPSTTVTLPAPPDSLSPHLDAVPEQTVAGVTTTTAPVLGPGTSSIVGTVTNPAGQPVAGATVEIDRVVGYAYASRLTTTAADGSFGFRAILGGDFRLRAWMAPDLDMPTPQQIFLTAGASQTVTLQEASYQGQAVQASINPADPVVGQPANLVVQVTDPVIDSEGVLREPPTAGAVVTLVNGTDWQVSNGNPLTTNSTGQAVFAVECTAAGSDPLSAQVGSAAPVTLQMPACSNPVPSTTTTTAPFSLLPTTTCAPSGASTTTLDFGSSC